MNHFEQYSLEVTIASTELTSLSLELSLHSLGFLLYENIVVVSSSMNFKDILEEFNPKLSISDFENFKFISNMIIDNERFIEINLVIKNGKFDVTYTSFKNNNLIASNSDSKPVLASLGIFYEDN